MASISTAQSGSFSSTSTWAGGVVPSSADDVTLNHDTVWDVSFTIHSLQINAGVTTSGTGHTYTITAGVDHQGVTTPTNGGIVAIGAGNTVVGDAGGSMPRWI